ncbi:MAG: succinylglutamate desuccinylase/aspartoacylase family protein [Desulfomonile tiedjei]|nr:succinylglutamate desuccinylase/aspartoacylase family protein [Desulfomonile tiedjei]
MISQFYDAVGEMRRSRFIPVGTRRPLLALLWVLLWGLAIPADPANSETTHRIHFQGTEAELHVYTITGNSPGPTLLLLGGIQGDEPGGYLAADLYADLTLKKGNLIVVPRANFLSIVENNRGVEGDMNRKFAGPLKEADRDIRVVEIVKELMKKSDFFLNLHDGSGFYSPKWESPLRNPMKFGQSIIADEEEYTRPDGKVLRLGQIARHVIEKVNSQMSVRDHLFKFNNHRTLKNDSLHKEQRLSATFHALTKVGIPAFASETSKTISDYRLRVRYQSMVINAFLDEVGIIPDNPRMYLENPTLKYLIVSVNGRTPIVVNGQDVLKVQRGDNLKLVHIESNYSRGLTARVKGVGTSFNDLNEEVNITDNTVIEVRKDRFLMGTLPVEIIAAKNHSAAGVHFEPKVRHFCVRVNDKTFMIEPGEELTVFRGDSIVLLDPVTNLPEDDLKSVRIDLRGFQADSSPYPQEDRGHQINTATDLQQKYAGTRGSRSIFSLQAKLNKKVFAESYIAVAEPRLEYLVLGESGGGNFVAYPGDKLELPANMLLKIVDMKTNIPESTRLSLTMAGRTLRWQPGSAGIDASKLELNEMPLDITRAGKSLGRIWLKQGKEFRLSSRGRRSHTPLLPVRY